MEERQEHCYCKSLEAEIYMITCTSCKKKFHPTCLKSGKPSPLAGDIYFIFTCSNCSVDGEEIVKRMKLQWTLVIMLALYNLQLEGSGKCGYFRWREHICRYIDKNWDVIFGKDRKQSQTWSGTVAGALSTGANRFFISGSEVLGENGWWTLKSSRMPAIEELEAIALNIKANRKRKSPEAEQIVLEGGRQKNKNVVEAAVALKEKKSAIDTIDFKPVKNKKKRSDSKIKQNIDYSMFPPNHKLKFIVDSPSTSSSYVDDRSNQSSSRYMQKNEQASPASFSFDDSNFSLRDSEPDLDMPSMYDMDMFNDLEVPDSFLNEAAENYSNANQMFKTEYESDQDSINEKIIETPKKPFPDTSRKRTVITKEESPIKDQVVMESKFELMSVYEEEMLLQKLEGFPKTLEENFEVRQLYRKLKVRKIKRERNLPVFDIDAEMRKLRGLDPPEYSKQESSISAKIETQNLKPTTIFDRFQANSNSILNKSQESTSFVTRLMGKSEEQLESIISPYSGRILKPFIYRDVVTKPLKLRLLEEILHKTNQSRDGSVPKSYPIDYCYVRPEFIPSINMLCHEYFWPGIDMQECLQYPDFSCVALYRKVIIGFAFMVPDVNYNEAYITFLFCHPEWRRAGIATFMLYHLIQTCMGRDITLHVSATSSAVLLYQKFCFKIEEVIHDFYDKYLPADSKECRHALFMRLPR